MPHDSGDTLHHPPAQSALLYSVMTSMKFALRLAGIVTLLFISTLAAQNGAGRIDAAFQKFWSATSPDEAERFVDDVIKSGVTFDDAMRRLKAGRIYTAQQTGIVKLSNKTKDGVEHFYALNVPANYDPGRRYQVRFQLHGGVGGRESNQPRGTGESPLQEIGRAHV